MASLGGSGPRSGVPSMYSSTRQLGPALTPVVAAAPGRLSNRILEVDVVPIAFRPIAQAGDVDALDRGGDTCEIEVRCDGWRQTRQVIGESHIRGAEESWRHLPQPPHHLAEACGGKI